MYRIHPMESPWFWFICRLWSKYISGVS